MHSPAIFEVPVIYPPPPKLTKRLGHPFRKEVVCHIINMYPFTTAQVLFIDGVCMRHCLLSIEECVECRGGEEGRGGGSERSVMVHESMCTNSVYQQCVHLGRHGGWVYRVLVDKSC